MSSRGLCLVFGLVFHVGFIGAAEVAFGSRLDLALRSGRLVLEAAPPLLVVHRFLVFLLWCAAVDLHVAGRRYDLGMLLWTIDETAGFDTAWASVTDGRLQAEGRAAGLRPRPYWIEYRLETDDGYATSLMAVESRWAGGSAVLELRRRDGRWTVNGQDRPDLADALDCDLAACPLTNTMPILRHDLHRAAGEHDFLIAFIEVPSLRVVPSRQRYTHLRRLDGGGAVVRYASGSFQSDLVIDADGFVVEYPQLGRRLEARELVDGIRADGPGSARPA